MERNGLPLYCTETQAEKDLRAGDIKEFWKGYEAFKATHPEMVADVSEKIVERIVSYGIEKDKYDRSVAEEALMVFIYAAHLTKDLRPSLTKNVPVPRVVISEDKRFESFQRNVKQKNGWKVIFDSWFDARLSYLLFPGNKASMYLEPWLLDNAHTVSKALSDRVIVELAATGAEEYAHELYIRKKSPDYLQKSRKGYLQAMQEYAHAEEKGNSEMASVLYHTADVERRGLIWTQNLLGKFFPHWTAGIRGISEKVSDHRIRYPYKEEVGIWRKLFGKK